MKNILSLVIVSILISGCSTKEPEKIYIKAPYYEFQTVDLKKAYIEAEKTEVNKKKLTSDEVMQVCKPLLSELNTIYKETKKFYDEQIKDYMNQNQPKEEK